MSLFNDSVADLGSCQCPPHVQLVEEKKDMQENTGVPGTEAAEVFDLSPVVLSAYTERSTSWRP